MTNWSNYLEWSGARWGVLCAKVEDTEGDGGALLGKEKHQVLAQMCQTGGRRYMSNVSLEQQSKAWSAGGNTAASIPG
jgi:hypothetical protein